MFYTQSSWLHGIGGDGNMQLLEFKLFTFSKELSKILGESLIQEQFGLAATKILMGHSEIIVKRNKQEANEDS